MDSTDSFEANSKVELLEHQSSKTTNSQKPRLIVAIFFIFLLTVIIAAIMTISAISNTHLSLLVADLADPIQTVCSVTRHRQSCYTSISSITNNTTIDDYWAGSNPESIAVFSIRVVSNQLTNLSSLFETLTSNSTDPGTISAARDCRDMFLRALSLENPVVSFDRGGIRKVKSWLFVARTGEENCMRRFIDSQLAVGEGLMLKVYELEKYVSNSLAILSNLEIIRQKFFEPPQLSDYVLILPQYLVLIFLFCLLFRLG